MTYYQGRLLNHIHLRVRDLESSKAFYKAVLEALGLMQAYGESPDAFFADELYVDETPGPVSRVHLAFQAASHDMVGRAYRAALEAGGQDNGPPGPRDYHSHYFAAFVFDPDGNNIEFICEAPLQRSAVAIEIQRLPKD